MITIDYTISEHDDGFRVADWFRGGQQILDAAERAATPEAADAILRGAYLGPDVDGVVVSWSIQ